MVQRLDAGAMLFDQRGQFATDWWAPITWRLLTASIPRASVAIQRSALAVG
jgi:hypothetical protein